jgi:hypothetical protein
MSHMKKRYQNLKFNLMKKFLFSGAIILLWASCMPDYKELSFDGFTNLKPRGDWQLPLATVTMTLEDIVADVEAISSQPNQPLTIFFFRENVFSAAISDYVEIEDQEILNTSITMGPSFIQIATEIGSTQGLELEDLVITSGLMKWETSTPLLDTVAYSFSIQNATRNGQPVSWLLTTVNGSASGTIPLDNLTFDLKDGPEPYNNILIRLDEVNAPPGSLGQNLDLRIEIENFEPFFVSGFFGNRVITLPADEVSFDLGSLRRVVDGVFFTNPKIDLYIKNQVGVPIEISQNIIGQNTAGLSQNLGLPPIQISAPVSIGDSVTTTYSVNNQNSQIVDFLRILPNRLQFDGELELNPSFASGQRNFVGFDTRMSADIGLEIPLSFGAQNLLFEQEINSVNFGLENPEEVSYLELHFNTKNKLPLGVNVTMIWTDTLGQPVDSVLLPLLSAAPVDANGRSNGIGQESFMIDFTDARLDSFLRTRKILLKARMNTTGGNPVSLYPDDGLEIKIATKITISDR